MPTFIQSISSSQCKRYSDTLLHLGGKINTRMVFSLQFYSTRRSYLPPMNNQMLSWFNYDPQFSSRALYNRLICSVFCLSNIIIPPQKITSRSSLHNSASQISLKQSNTECQLWMFYGNFASNRRPIQCTLHFFIWKYFFFCFQHNVSVTTSQMDQRTWRTTGVDQRVFQADSVAPRLFWWAWLLNSRR